MDSDGTCENSQVSASKTWLTLAALTCNWQLKLALNGEIINIMSAYAPQTGCGENEKIKFWKEMDEELLDIPDAENRRGLQWPLWME